MRIPSGVTDQYIYFVAVDSTDFTTRETGLTTFTVYRSRDGGAAAAMTTPTINETDATNMPGVYELLLDEDMTITSGNDSEEMCFHITQASMAPVTRTIELYRPKITAGNTLDVTATGAAGIDWGNIENKTTANDLSATDIQLCDTVTTLTNLPAITAGWLTAAGIATDAIGSDELATSAVTKIWAQIVETVGSRTAQQAMSLILAAVAGVTTDSGATIKDSAGTNTRISATINGSNERTAMTLTPSS